MTRVLVTGAAGFIGSHVSHRLLDRGDEVVGIDNLNAYYDPRLKQARLNRLIDRDRFRFEKLDLSDAEGIKSLFRDGGFDRVLHLAAQAGVRYSLTNPSAYIEANVVGFLNILEGCRHAKVPHLVYASSSSVYGANTKMPFSTHDNVDHPVSLYAATKKANELMAHCYSHLYRIPTTGLRFFTVYGPWGRPDMALFIFTRAILAGEPIKVFNHGRMRRDFTYIDDIVEAIERLIPQAPTATASHDPAQPEPATGPVPHRIFNIGNHTPIELGRFIEVIETAVGKTAVKRMLPMQPGDVPATYADVSRLAAAVGFAPRTRIEDGIGRFVAWYREYYGV